MEPCVHLGLRTVFVKELEGLCRSIAIEGIRELGNGRRNLETHVEDLPLPLQTYVFWPFYHARKIALWLDILTDSEIARSFCPSVLASSRRKM